MAPTRAPVVAEQASDLLDAGDALVVWSGPRPQLVLNAAGRAAIIELAAGAAPGELAQDLEALGLGRSTELLGAIGGLLQLGAAASPHLGLRPGEGPVDTAACERMFLLGPPGPSLVDRAVSPRTAVGREGAARIDGVRWAVLEGGDDDAPAATGATDVVVATSSDGAASLVTGAGIAVCTGGTGDAVEQALDAVSGAVVGARDRQPVGRVRQRDGSASFSALPLDDPAPRWARLLTTATRPIAVDGSGTTVAIDDVQLSIGPAVLRLDATDEGPGASWRIASPAVADAAARPGGRRAATGPALRHGAEVLLAGAPCSWSMKVSPGRLHRDRLLWAVPHGVLQDPVTWSALLDAFDAPEVVRALDPSGADEVLLGFEAATGAPLVHKLYLARATAVQGAALDSRLGPVEDGPGARVFDSVKWRPGLDDEVWRAVYDEPGPGPDAVDLVSGAFGRDAWRWAHAAIQLADVGPVLDVHASAVRPTMHAQNLLVTVDELGRTSFDARARWVADPVELIPSVRWLAREAGLSEADEDDLAVFASSRVERVIGGLAGDGSPFLTLYRASAPLDLGAAS